MKITVRQEGAALIAQLDEARLDAAVAIQFKDRMREIAVGAPDRVILDLSRVEFLDSSGLGAVIAVMKMLGPERRLELAALGPAVERVVRLTRMDTVFTIHAAVP
jgi:anti-sigma B factor antagonist